MSSITVLGFLLKLTLEGSKWDPCVWVPVTHMGDLVVPFCWLLAATVLVLWGPLVNSVISHFLFFCGGGKLYYIKASYS